ncbi:multidrug effflux MFS transporter [Planobispora siamensis]|uniref:Bcr/CflA family drug resistance efflux transporter n=1 Tax=Planobispora siamensis TaxID=936338 RepID=A0A8J3SIN7_9ACTN|nr:multidrug effflux MFS transporter [Planobispora siamensis]GIH93672.1 Bcr/CflA family drug resistance efflux transporter [Planobispora siamensis]
MSRSFGARKPATPPRPAFLILLTALSVLPVNVYLPALPDIADAFEADFALVNLSVAVYAVATALIEIVAGALSDRYGRRPVVLTSVSIFIVASIGCALAPDIGVFLVCRTFQAAIAACFSVAMVVIRETSGEREAVRRIGLAGMGWALAPMFGPTLGGILDELFGWRAIFVVLAILGGTVLVASMRQLKETSLHSGTSKGDLLASFRRILGSSRFWAYTLCMACSTGTLYVFLGGAPLVMGGHFGGSSVALGLHMAMVPAGFVLGSYLTGICASRFFRSHILVYARVLTCGGLLAGLILATSHGIHALAFFVSCMFIGVGNGLTTPVVNVGVMSERADLAGTATGLSAAMSIGGGALISSVAGLSLGAAGSVRILLALLLASASLALLAAIFAALVDRRPPA